MLFSAYDFLSATISWFACTTYRKGKLEFLRTFHHTVPHITPAPTAQGTSPTHAWCNRFFQLQIGCHTDDLMSASKAVSEPLW